MPGLPLECSDFLLKHDLVFDRIGMMWPLKPSFGLGVGEVSVLHNASVNAVADYDTFSVEVRHPVEVLAEEGGIWCSGTLLGCNAR